MYTLFDARPLAGVLLCLLPLLCGCGVPGERDDARRDAMLTKYFEPQAIAGYDCKRGLGSVPMRYTNIGFRGGISIGNDLGSNLVSLLLGQGVGRQVLLSDPDVSELLVFHEYMHQAQYSGFVTAELFRERFDRLRRDPAYAPAPVHLEGQVIFEYLSDPGFAVALIYDGGLDRELIAFVIEGWVRGDFPLPEYMLEVYRGTVKVDSLRPDRSGFAGGQSRPFDVKSSDNSVNYREDEKCGFPLL